jgi:ribosomal protein L32
MSVRMRINRSATRNRRSHHKLSKPATTTDGGGLALRHRVSPVTGTYKGKQIIDVNKKNNKKLAKAAAKAEIAETKAEAKAEKKSAKAEKKSKKADSKKEDK